MVDRDGGLVFDTGRLTVGEYLDRWLADCVKNTVRLSTYHQGYERIAQLHIKPALGRIKLRSLTLTHVRRLYPERLEHGLAPRMVQLVHTTLHKALGQAVADELTLRNVTDEVKAPSSTPKEIWPLNTDQSRTLLRATKGDRLQALYLR